MLKKKFLRNQKINIDLTSTRNNKINMFSNKYRGDNKKLYKIPLLEKLFHLALIV